jgi:hypothetical protein
MVRILQTETISPIKISNRWIWSYKSLTPDSNSDWDNYYQWQCQYGLIGCWRFTMKGTGGVYSVEKLQNYVFTGNLTREQYHFKYTKLI